MCGRGGETCVPGVGVEDEVEASGVVVVGGRPYIAVSLDALHQPVYPLIHPCPEEPNRESDINPDPLM